MKLLLPYIPGGTQMTNKEIKFPIDFSSYGVEWAVCHYPRHI